LAVRGRYLPKNRRPSHPPPHDGSMCLYAPDVTVGSDERYYLYYVLDKVLVVSVAACDTPAGKYEFYGYVHYSDGTRLGERQGDEPQFDPGILTEGDKAYLYTWFCGHGDRSRSGAMATVLDADMLTIIEDPAIVIPGNCHGKGTEYEGHEYFEAASIRRHGDLYYFVYSSTPMHELCYATSRHPLNDFKYGSVIVSNCDKNISSYKPADKPMNFANANNHGSIIEISGDWYVFYHRHTNGTWYSRQGCVEQIGIELDGSIRQVEITSQGANGKPLVGKGEYLAYIACNLFRLDERQPDAIPRITQDGKDSDEETGFVTNITDSTGVGFKYFECRGVTKVKIRTRGYSGGVFEVRTSWDGNALGGIPVDFTNVWAEFSADIAIPDGVWSLYFVYKGTGATTLGSFTLE